ncbi:hypothetical protein Pcinc_001476 [Petrolisthes cinctipes]|uniref:Uncharacterized protein n=1 Tax=Petrolisthes cinctipes TaxID=88211 RepID=A0AAE1GMP3_PETCI|nr:hypothetical protein Pcinc_001476 [Petrolisthes cinctipes]
MEEFVKEKVEEELKAISISKRKDMTKTAKDVIDTLLPEIAKVYDFDPLFSDVHCGIAFTLKNSQKKEQNPSVAMGMRGIEKVNLSEKNIKPDLYLNTPLTSNDAATFKEKKEESGVGLHGASFPHQC